MPLTKEDNDLKTEILRVLEAIKKADVPNLSVKQNTSYTADAAKKKGFLGFSKKAAATADVTEADFRKAIFVALGEALKVIRAPGNEATDILQALGALKKVNESGPFTAPAFKEIDPEALMKRGLGKKPMGQTEQDIQREADRLHRARETLNKLITADKLNLTEVATAVKNIKSAITLAKTIAPYQEPTIKEYDELVDKLKLAGLSLDGSSHSSLDEQKWRLLEQGQTDFSEISEISEKQTAGSSSNEANLKPALKELVALCASLEISGKAALTAAAKANSAPRP